MIRFFEDNFAVLDAAVSDFPWESQDHYEWFLAQTYFYVSHSTRLLALAAARFGAADESLHQRFLKHTTEEKSHHLLAVHDLKALGKRVADYSELPMAAALYEAQYYKIEFQDPTALFGYIMALEILAVRQGRHIFERVRKAYGVKAASFLKVHAEEDVSHVEEGLKHLAQLDPSKLDRIKSNFVQTAESYANLLQAISTRAASVENLAVAL
jgi:uncharacterized ferritin-like protein (DUF455 family)